MIQHIANNPFSFRAWKLFLTGAMIGLGLHNSRLVWQSIQGYHNRSEMLSPISLVLGVTLICRSLFSEAPVGLKITLAIAASGLNFRYLDWRIQHTLVLDGYNGWISIIVLAMEMIAILNVTLISYQTLVRTNHSPTVDAGVERLKSGRFAPSVDIFVPTYNESIEILRRTLVGCQKIAYADKTIWLLDDGNRPEAAELARSLQCNYLTRSESTHAKAGNLNHGLEHAAGEIVAVFDADFIPLNHFLERTLPLFEDSQVAMVITPQNFYNPDPPEINLGGGLLPHEQTTFYSIIQSGRDATNSPICTGTSTVMRRSAIDEIGRIPIRTIVEDWVTGFRLQAKGYRTLYLNEMLSIGAAPENLEAYLLQRIRWAEGTLRTMFGEHNPLKLPGLNLVQRINHLSGVLYWIDQATQSIGYIAPALFFLFGMRSMNASVPNIIAYWVPNYIAGLFTVSWVVGSRTIIITHVYNALQSFHLVPMIVLSLIRPNASVKFKVTPKGVIQKRSQINWKLMAPVLALFALNLILFITSTFETKNLNYSETHLINTLWAGWNTMILGLAILAGIDVVQERSSLRVDESAQCEIVVADEAETQVRSRLINLSEEGLTFKLPSGFKFDHGQLLKLRIPSESMQFSAQVCWISSTAVGCQFLAISDEQQIDLMDWIYCRHDRWSRPQVADEATALKSLFLSLFDLYPLKNLR
ncbi:MAG: glycosyltransferase [Leptolyngbya sp. Prado105]|nr:glycosyltransferase [Leptolyngbya sp. Prado105]